MGLTTIFSGPGESTLCRESEQEIKRSQKEGITLPKIYYGRYGEGD